MVNRAMQAAGKTGPLTVQGPRSKATLNSWKPIGNPGQFQRGTRPAPSFSRCSGRLEVDGPNQGQIASWHGTSPRAGARIRMKKGEKQRFKEDDADLEGAIAGARRPATES